MKKIKALTLTRAAMKRPDRMTDADRVLSAASKDFGLDISKINKNELVSKANSMYEKTNMSRLSTYSTALLKMVKENKSMKLSKKELETIIMETLLEMVEAGDEGLINLMRENEKLHGEVEEDLNEWVENTKGVLKESLGVEQDFEPEDDSEMLTESHIQMLDLADIITEGADKDAARELELYIDNDGQLYNSQYLPILKNLSKKMAKGKYDPKLATKLWMYLVDAGAKKYHKEFADQGISSAGGKWNDIFNKATRLVVAKELEKNNREGIEDGDYL